MIGQNKPMPGMFGNPSSEAGGSGSSRRKLKLKKPKVKVLHEHAKNGDVDKGRRIYG